MISAFASSSNFSSLVSSKKYDVFISFRGEDTRTNFTSHLYEALKQRKVEIYIDYRLERGEEISLALIKAIKDSHISIIILSENYASSKWCLEELNEILDSKKNHGQIVIPVFYNIDPSHVRNQSGSFGQAFAKHEGEPKFNKWKAALIEVAKLSGWDSRNRIESDLLKDIIGDVMRKLTLRYPNELRNLVGIEDHYKGIEALLNSNEVRTIGLWGMGGIGKTTIASALYAKLSYKFEGRCFLTNVRERSNKEGVEALHNTLFSKLLDNKNYCFDEPFSISTFVMHRLGCKKVLIVLDDVDTPELLEYLTEGFDFLGEGSKVIITTRYKQIFNQVDEVYYVKELSWHHSLQLFCLTVFGKEQPKLGYEDLSRSVISYCKGNPLALKVLGAILRRKSIEAWKSELRKLQETPNMKIHDILKLSYEDLDLSQKDIFLDIACFFKGEDIDSVKNVLEASNFFATSGIEVLLDYALITISFNNKIEMHDLIHKMGQEIVRQESIKFPGRRSRLWKPEEVREVLKNNTGSDAVEGIILNLDTLPQDLHLSPNAFAKMTNVRFLKIYREHHYRGRVERFNVYLDNGLESLSHKLRYLWWEGFWLESLPFNFCPEQLVELCIPGSKLKMLWDGVQNVVNLKRIDLEGSRDLIKLPDLSKAEKLESICVCYCESLHLLHPSVSSLPKLTYLCLSYCREIKSIDVHSKSLRNLILNECSSLNELSVTSKEMTMLNLSNTPICTLPSTISQNKKLACLWLNGCNFIDKLSLQTLLHNIGHFSSLEFLGLEETNIESLPTSIKSLSSLTCIELSNCRKLVSLPELPPSLRELELQYCTKLMSLTKFPPSLEQVDASNCTCLEENFTQQLVLQHMLQSHITYLEQQYSKGYHEDYSFYLFPGEHVTKECRFHSVGSSITIPHLPLPSHICGFIYCVILPKGLFKYLIVRIVSYIYQDGEKVGFGPRFLFGKDFNSDHLMLYYEKKLDALNCNLPFKFEFSLKNGLEPHDDGIKECGVFPVYKLESGYKVLVSGNTKIFDMESTIQISLSQTSEQLNWS